LTFENTGDIFWLTFLEESKNNHHHVGIKQGTQKDMRSAQMKEISLFLLVIALWTSAQVLLKWGLTAFSGQKVDLHFFLRALGSWPVLTGTLLSAAGALLWLVVLSRFELSYANLMVSFMYALIVIASAVIFKEHISSLRWLGAFLIMLGVFLVSQTR
jgi:drug/metabolite transporter (DMT)-like permease